MNDDLLSVVMPVYNAEDFLPKSIGAILAQSYKKIELILTDDGSTDNSGKICDGFAEKDPRVRVYHKVNGGHSSAVNFGLERMTGKYVMVCDADDYYEPDAFEIAVNRIRKSPDCDVIIFAFFRPDREITDNPADLVTFDKRTIDKCLLSGQTYEFCDVGFHIESTCAKIMRAELVRKHRIRMPENLFLDEDAVFCLYLYEHCRKVEFDSHHIYHYEVREDSFCRKYSDVAVRMLPEILKEQEKYIEKYHPNDREYIAANDNAVFAWFNEAEDHYFFNEGNNSSFYQVYQQYRTLLMEPTVRKHIRDIQFSEISSSMRKIRYAFYKNPSLFLFILYFLTKVRKNNDE